MSETAESGDPMTKSGALAEAQRRWGRHAFVNEQRTGEGSRYEVGKLRITDSKRRVLGWSLHTWEKAFERAKRRSARAYWAAGNEEHE
jgi:hypothetical protein